MFTLLPLRGECLVPLLLVVTLQTLEAQTFETADPAMIGLSGSTVSRSSSNWNCLHNPAALSRSERPAFSVSVAPSSLNQLPGTTGIILLAVPFADIGVFGASATHFGAGTYRESMITISGASYLTSEFAVGTSLRLAALSIEHYGSSIVPLVDLGVVLNPASRISLGIATRNITRTSIADDPVPQSLSLGVSWDVDSNAALSIDARYRANAVPTISAGCEYRPLNWCILRTGLSTGGQTVGLGLSIERHDITLELGTSFSLNSGIRNVVGVGYSW